MVDVTRFIPFDKINATIPDCHIVERRLSQLRGTFADPAAYERALLEQSDPLVYSVASVELGESEGDLHYGIGKIMPGRVGQEYFLTRGHFHAWRPAAEIYIGLAGAGMMLLENEQTQQVYSVDLLPDTVVYVPGYTAHRTVNVGETPLTYLGIYPARAGHDYGALEERNFTQIVIAQDGKPLVTDRQAYLATLALSR